jgi:hypothetical protein
MYEAIVFLGIIGSLYWVYRKISDYQETSSEPIEFIWMGKGPAPRVYDYENEEDDELLEAFSDFPPEKEEEKSVEEEESYDMDYITEDDEEE